MFCVLCFVFCVFGFCTSDKILRLNKNLPLALPSRNSNDEVCAFSYRYIYIYIYMCVCVCVCVSFGKILQCVKSLLRKPKEKKKNFEKIDLKGRHRQTSFLGKGDISLYQARNESIFSWF